MTPFDADVSLMAGRGRPSASQAVTKHLLAVGLDRARLEGVSALTSPHVNLFVTSSPQKALLWTRLERLDLILLRFGSPVEQAVDLLQALIEANPAPPILLLVEPEAEEVAHHLTRRQICAAQPASIPPEQLTQQVLRLLGPATGRSIGPRPAAVHPVAPAHPLPPPSQPFSPHVQPLQEEPISTPHRVAIVTDQHEPMPKPQTGVLPSPTAPLPPHNTAPVGPPPSPSPLPLTAAPAGWEPHFLDQLVIELAHRLKNPLVSIKTFTHLLQERFNDPDFRGRFYAIVNHDVIQLNDVVDRLLEFTEFSRPYPRLLNLADELRQVKESLAPMLQHRQVTIQLMAPDAEQAGVVQLSADPTQFRYLLKQLLMDSAAVAPAGGHLQVRLTGPQAGGGQSGPTGSILIDVMMAATASRLHDWLSLELLLAKNLMERHGGAVTVAVTGDGDNRRRRVTAAFPLNAVSRHDGQPPAASPAPSKPAAPSTVDRRRIPLSIAFRERRVGPRRHEHHAITFADRRRPPEGDGARTGSPPPLAPE